MGYNFHIRKSLVDLNSTAQVQFKPLIQVSFIHVSERLAAS